MLNADLYLCFLLYPINVVKFLSLRMCSLEAVRSKDNQASSLGCHMQSGMCQVAWEGCPSRAVAVSCCVPLGTGPSLPGSALLAAPRRRGQAPAQQKEVLFVLTSNLCTKYVASVAQVGRDLGRPCGPTPAQSRANLSRVAHGCVHEGWSIFREGNS